MPAELARTGGGTSVRVSAPGLGECPELVHVRGHSLGSVGQPCCVPPGPHLLDCELLSLVMHSIASRRPKSTLHAFAVAVVYISCMATNSAAVPVSGSISFLGAGSDQQSAEPVDEDMIRTHMRRVFRLVYRIVGNVPDAEDLTQEAFAKALSRRSQLRDCRKDAQWLNRIAVNAALDFVRKRNRVTFESFDEVFPSKAETPEDWVERHERRSWLEAGLQRLTERERTALLLRDVLDMSAPEVAEVMGCAVGTVRSHIANVRIKFHRYKALQPY